MPTFLTFTRSRLMQTVGLFQCFGWVTMTVEGHATLPLVAKYSNAHVNNWSRC